MTPPPCLQWVLDQLTSRVPLRSAVKRGACPLREPADQAVVRERAFEKRITVLMATMPPAETSLLKQTCICKKLEQTTGCNSDLLSKSHTSHVCHMEKLKKKTEEKV